MGIKSKLVVKDLGNPKIGAALNAVGDKHLLGTIIGMASGIFIRTTPTGEAYEGLKGNFKGVPADPKVEDISSGVLYLPGGIYELVAEQVKALGEEAGGEVSFGFEVYTVRSSNAAGYSYEFQPLQKPTVTDPLEALQAKLLGDGGTIKRASPPQLTQSPEAASAASEQAAKERREKEAAEKTAAEQRAKPQLAASGGKKK